MSDHDSYEVPRPTILRRCSRCNVTRDNVAKNRVIVSPRGTAHFARYDGVYCDRRLDATGDGWWWPL